MKHLLIFLCLAFFSHVSAQQQQSFTLNGAALSHYVTAGSIPSGASFGYVYTFTIPAGAKVAIINAVVDNTVEFLTIPTANGTAVPFITSSNLPAAGSMGGNIGYKIEDSTPDGFDQDISGTVVFSVRFPNGVTCNNTVATSKIGIEIQMANGTSFGISTSDIGVISTTATAQNYWTIQKNLASSNWFYGPGGSSCPRSFFQRDIVYEFVISNGNEPYGQLNLYDAVVTDIVSGLNGQVVGLVTPSPTTSYDVNIAQADISPGFGTYSDVSFDLGDLLVHQGTGPFEPTRRRFWVKVKYDDNTSGCKTNKCELKGSLGGVDASNPCVPTGIVDTDDETIHLMSDQPGFFSKQVRTNGAPGCPVYYALVFSAGATPVTFTHDIVDVLPALPIGYTWQNFVANNPNSGHCSSPTLATNGGNQEVSWSFSASCPFTIPAYSTQKLDFYVTLDPNLPAPYSEICNEVTVVSDDMQSFSGEACFTPQAYDQICLYKEVLNPQANYHPGDMITYRLRIQNLGTKDLPANSVIEEYLSDNFEYVGNVLSYTSPTYPPQTSTSWGISPASISTSADPAIQKITFDILDPLDKSCSLYALSCSNVNIPPAEINNGQPFYYLEFQARVRDTSAIGVVANNFSVFRPGVSTPLGTSNRALVQIEQSPAFSLVKSVRANAGDPWGQTASIDLANGSTTAFQIELSPVGTPMYRRVGIADLLPRNDGINDLQILNRQESRAADFDLVTANSITSTPLADYFNAGTTANNAINNWQPSGLSYFLPLAGSTGTTSWATGISSNEKNIGIHFAPNAGNATLEFQAKTTQQNQADRKACNSSAGNISVKLMEGAAPFRHWNWGVINTPVESNLVCVSTQAEAGNACCQTILDTVFQCVKPAPAISFINICIANQSSQGSDICRLTITPSNTNLDWGSVYLDQNSTPITGAWDAQEDQLVLNFDPGTDPFAATETHCLQLNYAGVFSGDLTIHADYCETSCDTSFVWEPENVALGENHSNMVLTEQNPGNAPLYPLVLRLSKSDLPNAQRVKFISFIALDTDAKLVAATGAALEINGLSGNTAKLQQTLQSGRNAVFVLAENTPIEDNSVVNLIFQDEQPSKVMVILRAENGEIIDQKTYIVQ